MVLEPPKAIVGGTLIDGTGKRPIKDGTVVILGPWITEVGPSAKVDVPKNAEIINAEGKTVMPGFIDCHTHFTGLGLRRLTTMDLSNKVRVRSGEPRQGEGEGPSKGNLASRQRMG